MVVVGDEITVTVKFKNTGTSSHNFPVGVSLLKPGGGWLDFPYQTISVTPGGIKTLTFHKTMQSSYPKGSYGYDAAVWHSENGGDLSGELDREQERNVFTLT